MGHRLSKIYTRTGDAGETGLGDGARVAKDHPRIEAIGDIDELNCQLGVLLCTELPDKLRQALTGIQQRLFDIGAGLSMPGMPCLPEGAVEKLETLLDELNATLPPLKEFILPGGSQAAASCHVARAVCRRSERRLVTLARQEALDPAIMQYVNRLSDLLFVMARVLARLADSEEVQWRNPSRADPETSAH
ncbi:MAG TPA: cob(I)yrinic acid a,c-diamide adenosyltransferase [Gammaproteobacteria bacterium]|nr:cob(I)yrinic acid a,c-diamide adenosyltransferase [Gammaproteobacteria bacterium]